MAETRSGPSTATIALIALIATPVVLFIIFWLAGSGSASATSTMPDVRFQGVAWAKATAKDAGFGNVDTHDALGRDRGISDKDWMVCFQKPSAGVKKSQQVEIGAVKIGETCPATDQDTYQQAGVTMPDLRGKTAFIESKTLGKNASVKYQNTENGDFITHSLGDYWVCQTHPAGGEVFNGRPVMTWVVPYGHRCPTAK